uniref:Uncharacterized protein n=1 Tax=Cacopsylla melanoneura TaxID=428564 RepID=A0A8D8TKD5_9HEMI
MSSGLMKILFLKRCLPMRRTETGTVEIFPYKPMYFSKLECNSVNCIENEVFSLPSLRTISYSNLTRYFSKLECKNVRLNLKYLEKFSWTLILFNLIELFY